MESRITPEKLAAWSDAWRKDPERRLAALALSSTDLKNVSRDPNRANDMHQRFSVEVRTLDVADQQNSGRCWLFAASNVVRERIAAELDLERFELSQSWLAFWDKFERVNYFLEQMLALADRPTDDREVAFALQTGVHDGGQWDMFVNVAEKYGLVPKDAFDETWQSSHTRDMNYLVNRAAKAAAVRLRRMKRDGAAEEDIAAFRDGVLGRVYGFLCSCYGEPPRVFDFEYTDRGRVFHAERGLTPKAFYERYAAETVRGAVSCIHAPTADKPYGRTFTVRGLGNVLGGRPVCHLNLDMADLKAAVIRQLQDGRVVWFGSDVGHDGDRERGIWDDRLFDFGLLSGLDLDIGKADALDYGFAAMNHAMVLTGVNLVDGRPNRWKIENSWGDKHGEKGYYVCSDSWFDRYVFQAAVDRAYLGDLAALADQPPIELDPWDPMGTLAD